SVPASARQKFFRISISDVDSDNDRLTDWEEYQLGLDPLDPNSNGQHDGNGQPINDYAYAIGKLAAQNAITISATDPTANQPDPGQTAQNIGILTVTRAGFPLSGLLVNLGMVSGGPGVAVEGVDHIPVYRSVFFPPGSSSQTVTVTPLANTNRISPVVATVQVLPGSGYTVGTSGAGSVVIYPSATATGTGLSAEYYTNSSTTYSSPANFNGTNLVLLRIDPTVDFTWGSSTNPITNSGYYTVRWTGQVQPEFSETYYFDANTDDGVKVWVNDQLIIDSWRRTSGDHIGTIPLQGGVKYNLKMEYFNSGGSAGAHLSWYSASQPKQVIPSTRLYPPSVAAPSVVTSPLMAVAFLGQPFSYTVTGANSVLSYTATGLPPGLSFNSTNGVISGTPNLAGEFQVMLTVSNSGGLGAASVDIRVIDTGSSVVREVWTGVPGVNIADIPVGLPPVSMTPWGTLQGSTDFGDNYGERIRGYFTAPATGNYYFWIAGSDSAELWISNDSEPANKVKRAYVLPTANPASPPANGTGARQWTVQPSQRSPWLTMVAGQPYYFEVLHKAGVGAGDNWAVGWLQDPTGTNTAPADIVPSYLLSRYYPAPVSQTPGTLYSANVLALPGVPSIAAGSATLRLTPDGTQAVLRFQVSDLSSPVSSAHIDSDPYLNNPSQIIFDISAATPEPDGSYVWGISPTGTLSVDDILEIIREGKASINLHTALNPAGEVQGHFTLANGTQTFTPPPPPP
ncbi:MAG TPA: PA14 domain-containing protein, partial [Verrucomicrobiae bacterium]|nr:PA14 domain-containing protein [Verrucomicrobiae bacterium]